jgi:hypothetical protein
MVMERFADRIGETPLHKAAKQGNEENSKLLLERCTLPLDPSTIKHTGSLKNFPNQDDSKGSQV